VRQQGKTVKHEGSEYVLMEDGYNEATRAVVFLARAGDPRFVGGPSQRPTELSEHPGDWRTVARWTQHELHIPEADHEEHRDFIATAIDEYVSVTPRPAPVAWTLGDGDAFAGTLEPALPMGVAIPCYDTEEQARADVGSLELVPIDDLRRFFNHVVRLGYAGAMWNAERPVFFCADPSGDLHYLRLGRGGPGKLAMEILDELDRWDSYDGAEEISFLDNGDACDERLVEKVGNKPLMGWPADGHLHSVGPTVGQPALFDDDSDTGSGRYAVLFTEAAAADDFREDLDEAWTTFEVADPSAFLRSDVAEGHVVQLNPGGHRARSGTMWSSGDAAVLDSFSGFWKLTPDGFEALD
jgi:hypothetical protein